MQDGPARTATGSGADPRKAYWQMDRTAVGIQTVTRWPSGYARVSQCPGPVTVSQPVGGAEGAKLVPGGAGGATAASGVGARVPDVLGGGGPVGGGWVGGGPAGVMYVEPGAYAG